MAWRVTEQFIEGVLDNTVPNKVTGWMKFAGLNENVIFYLEGNFHRDIRGAKVQPDSDYPPVSEIITTFENITDALTPCLDKIDASELDAELKDPYPVQEKTVLNGLAFLSFHETYHIGQIGFIRKLLGYPTLAG